MINVYLVLLANVKWLCHVLTLMLRVIYDYIIQVLHVTALQFINANACFLFFFFWQTLSSFFLCLSLTHTHTPFTLSLPFSLDQKKSHSEWDKHKVRRQPEIALLRTTSAAESKGTASMKRRGGKMTDCCSPPLAAGREKKKKKKKERSIQEHTTCERIGEISLNPTRATAALILGEP